MKGLSSHMDGWAPWAGLPMRPGKGSWPARLQLAEEGGAWGETSQQTE